MRKKLKLAAFVGAVAFLATLGTASAQTSVMNKCQGAKIKGAGKKAACLAGLQAKLVGSGAPVDPIKVGKCEAKVGAAFAKLEGKGGCNTTGDATAIETKVDNFVDDITAELSDPPLPNKCQGAKIKDAGKKAACLAGLEAKFVGTGAPVDPAKVLKCEAKVGAAYAKLEGKGDCNSTGDAGAIETKVDNFVDDLVSELNVPGGPSCCPATRISTSTGSGTLVVGVLTAFPFPPGVITTVDIAGSTDGCCKHDAIIPPGGFTVPIFCIPALNFTSTVTALGCESGSGDGNGFVWDGDSTCADADVFTTGDTSDGSCNPAGQPCNTTAGGASNNTLGNINTTIGDLSSDPPGAHTAIAIPVDSLTWSAADASCPDADGTFNSGTDSEVSHFKFILRPTTAKANASFVDQNGDGCSRGSGTAGPNNTRSCDNNHAKPCGANSDCPGSACNPSPIAGQTTSGALQGTPAPGPCCTPGQTQTVVATGIAFSGGAPLFDLIFANSSPATITGCSAPASNTCTLTTNACLQ